MRREASCTAAVLLAGVFALLLASPARAQEPAPERAPVAMPLGAPDTLLHEQWTVRDGLPVNHVNGTYRTPDGYLWIATYDGLVRFDGLNFTAFGTSDVPELPSNRVRTIRPGHGGSFWVSYAQGYFVRVTAQTGGADARFDPFPARTYGFRKTYLDGDSLTWLATSGGLYRYRLPGSREGGKGRSRPVFEEALAGQEITDVRRDASGMLWIGAGTGEVWKAAGGNFVRAEPPPGLRLATSLGDAYRQERGDRCPDGTRWSVQGGRVVLRDGQQVARVGGSVRSLRCDAAGNVWVATQRDGLHRFGRPLLRTYGPEEGLGMRNVYGIYEDRSGALWFSGLGESRVSRLAGGTVRHYERSTHYDGFSNGEAFYEDRAGNLWLGLRVCPAAERTSGSVCSRFDWAEGAPERDRGYVYAIEETRDGTLWFGTHNALYRLHEGEWSAFQEHSDGGHLPEDYIHYLLESRSGETLYVATLGGGVLRYEDEQFQDAIDTADGLLSNNIRALYEDDDGYLWIGTEDRGLARYDPETGAVATVHQQDGLHYDGIHQILEDDDGRLWMSTNRGLFWVRRAELNAFIADETEQVTSTFYTERDGMRNREANGGRQQAAIEASDGRFWFATQDGAVVVDPAEVTAAREAPAPVVEQVTASGSRRADSSSSAASGAVRLDAEERSFRVSYTAPTFQAPERVRFRYRLDGYDDGWVEAGQRREAAYTKVPPGKYTFRVAASSAGGAWSEEEAALSLSVAPYFYETWWFAALCVGLAALLLAGSYRWRTHHLRRRQQTLRRQVRDRTQALRTEKQRSEQQAERLREVDRQKSRFFTNVSHEFRTPLTLTIGPLEDLQSDRMPSLPVLAREKVDLALRNSRRLLRLIGQLLDTAKLDAGELQLDARRADLVAFVRSLARSFAPLAERRRVRFEMKNPPGPLPVSFDADKLEKIVGNLLSNAFKFTPRDGAICITVARALETDGEAEAAAFVSVRDSGRGIAPDALPHLFERFYQATEAHAEGPAGTGVGLSLAKDLVELHGGTLDAESTLGEGATFTVRLPMGSPREDEAAPPHTGAPPSVTLLAPGSGPAGDGQLSAPPDPAQPAAPSAERAEDEDRTTVLVADDNAEIRAYVRSHLEAQYRVIEATNGREALEKTREALPDLVVSDVMMPRLDGFGLVEALRADPETDFLPVVLLTARAAQQDKIEGIGEGADAYLTKPFSVRELQTRVQALIASRRRLRERFATGETVLPENEPGSATGDGLDGGDPEDEPDGLSPAEVDYLLRVREAIWARMAEDSFGVETLADAMGQSRSTLYRRLRSSVGQSPTAFIREVRLERAAALLREGHGTVSEVAYAVGFESVSYFSKIFRKAYGVRPSGYPDALPVEAR